MKAQDKFTCKCGKENKVTFRKPHYGQPTNVHLTCIGCQSRLRIKYEKDFKLPPGQLRFDVHLIECSPKLADFLRLQERLKANIQKDVDQAQEKSNG